MTSPYRLRWQKDHISVSEITQAVLCEALHAYTYIFQDVPDVPLPAAMVFGTATHKLLEMTGTTWWKRVFERKRPLEADEGKKFVKFGGFYIENVLTGKHGPRGTNDPVRELQWFYGPIPSDKDRDELISTEIKKYKGKIYNILEAFRLSFTVQRSDFMMHFERPFLKGIRLFGPDGMWSFPLEGTIDLIRVFEKGYVLIDYKTGPHARHYDDRVRQVTDVQMTIYSHVMEREWKVPPDELCIQSLEFSTDFLNDHKAETLQQKELLKRVPPRNAPVFITEIGKLAQDIRQIVEYVVNPSRHSQKERDEWTATSTYGRQADFAQSVRECRFVPRIGPWCRTCLRVTLCQNDHIADWKKFLSMYASSDFGISEKDSALVIPETETKPTPGKLFSDPPRRSEYMKKSDRIIRKDLLDTGNFVSKAKIMPIINKVWGLLQSLGPCPCLKLKLFPLWLLPYVPELIRQKPGLNIRQVASNCPHPDCPRRQLSK